jgi:hypothetical protein
MPFTTPVGLLLLLQQSHVLIDNLPRKDRWDYISIAITLALVIIGAITFWEVRRQAIETAKSAKAAADSVGAMNRQAEILERQTKATEDAAVAAKEGAEATKRSIELMVRKERAQIRVRIKPLNLHPVGGLPAVEYTVHFFGMTNAFVRETQAIAFVSNSDERETGGVRLSIRIPDVITPASPPQMDCSTFPQPNMTLEQATIEKIEHRQAFIHFYGFIKYDDAFGQSQETTFRWLWTVTDMPSVSGGGPFSYWKEYGGAEDNRTT